MPIFILFGLLAACTRPVSPKPDATAHVPTPYGGYTGSSGLVLPRAALVHLTSSTPLEFEATSEGARLLMDESGLLGQIGVFAGDEVVTNDIEAMVDSWFTADRSEFQALADGEVRTLTVVWHGPPIAPPERPMTSLGQASSTVLLPAASNRQINRSVLAHLPSSSATPLRNNGVAVGYRLQGPIADVLGVSEVRTNDGVAIVTDQALWNAIDSWLVADETTLEDSSGPRRFRWVGPPTTPPAVWTLPITIDDDEARAREGVRLRTGGATLPRTLFHDHLDDTLSYAELQPMTHSGIPLDRLLPNPMPNLLGLERWQEVTRVDDIEMRIHVWDDYARFEAARNALLTQENVRLTFASGDTFVLALQGPPIELAEDWMPAISADPPFTRGVSLGDVVVVDRLAMRRLIAQPVDCRPDMGMAASCGAHPLWTAIGLPYGGITRLDGQPLDSFHKIPLWVMGLCVATEASLSADPIVPRTVEIRIQGPPVPCP